MNDMASEKNKVYPYIDETGIHFSSELWSSIPMHKEHNDMPSMVENVYNPTIAEILANPGVLVKPRTPRYDDGEEISPVSDSWNNDIQDSFEFAQTFKTNSNTSEETPTESASNSEAGSPQASEEVETSEAK